MATTTDNYGLILVSGEDRVNPLTQVNPNFEAIDTQLKANANAGVGIANEIKTATVHALTRITNDGDCAVFRFLATSNFQLGDSFTVDGVSVTALLPSGEPLGNGAYVIGSTVLCSLIETRLTVYATGGTAADSNALDGHPASYFLNASNESFDNTGTDLTATNTEDAIKQLANKTIPRIVQTLPAGSRTWGDVATAFSTAYSALTTAERARSAITTETGYAVFTPCENGYMLVEQSGTTFSSFKLDLVYSKAYSISISAGNTSVDDITTSTFGIGANNNLQLVLS